MKKKNKKTEKEKFISHKMHIMKDEDKPQKQKLAIAFSYAKKKGL